MLSRELITVRTQKGAIHPTFIRTDAPALLELARRMIEAYRAAAAEHRSVSWLKEFTAPLIDGALNRRFAKALEKLLDERTVTATAEAADYPALRRSVFAATAELIRRGNLPAEINAFRNAAAATAGEAGRALLESRLYADLPEYDCIAEFTDIEPGALLQRYNTALVQGILLNTSGLTVTVATGEAPRLRRLVKYLRFFQLLASLEKCGEGDGEEILRMKMEIAGPLSILEQSRRYGVQLATFFPAVCTMDKWQISAVVNWMGKELRLELDESSGLTCHYHNFAAYLPDEIRAFHTHFRESSTDWKIVGDTPFIKAGGREIIIPDLSFRHRDGTLVHLELFNRWNNANLRHRLQWLEKHPKQKLILGVDNSVAAKADNRELLEASGWFACHGFTYRDYPTCSKTVKALESRRKQPAKPRQKK